MKRSILALFMLLSAGVVTAATGGGFAGSDGVQETTVADAKNLPDDAQVKVTGYLVRSVGDEEYQFQDDTGSLIAEIDEDEWQGAEVDPNTRVVLTGELDQDSNDVELDVDHVAIAQ